ncbi:hypothetical protein ABKV19_025735 [Rosa sericea]
MLTRQTLDEQELIEVPNLVVVLLLISPKRRLPRGKKRLVRLEVPQRPKSQFYLEVTFSTLPRGVTSQSKENYFSKHKKYVYFSRDPHGKELFLQSVGKIFPRVR